MWCICLNHSFKHLLKYGDENSAGEQQWRFALHPRFPYWALNMKQRHQVLSQAKIYLRQNPGNVHISLEELKEMVGNLRGEQLKKRIQRYTAKILRSSQYWFQRYLELSALLEQVGTPTFFGRSAQQIYTGLTFTLYRSLLTKIVQVPSSIIHVLQIGTTRITGGSQRFCVDFRKLNSVTKKMFKMFTLSQESMTP